MTLLALSGGDVALIIVAIAWVFLVAGLCVVLLSTFNVLTSTRMTIDTFREETVPLLKEVLGTVERANRELDRVDSMLESAGTIVARVEKLSGLVEQAASSPMVKLISVGAGLRKAAGRMAKGKESKGRRPKESGS